MTAAQLAALRDAESYFAADAAVWPIAQALLLGALERWPEAEIVTQRSQVGLRDPRPFCALWLPQGRGVPIPAAQRPAHYLMLSLFLPRPLETPRPLKAVEPYPGRWTNHLLLARPEEADGELWRWAAEARAFRCKK